ncbi:MAG: TldD/PmbA family protein [Nanoarchaeota archaeon]|nr:TldD/PmbA family protein [Nanoarchaeota archaeon]
MDTAEYLLRKLKKQMDDVVIEVNSNTSTQLKFVDNKIVKTGTEQLRNLEIFAVKDKKIVNTGFRELAMPDDTLSTAALNVSKQKADELIRKLTKFSGFMEPKEDYYGIGKGKNLKYKKIKEFYDKKVKDIDSVDYVEKAINAALKEKARKISGILENHESYRRILTSERVDISEIGTNLYLSLRAMFNENASGHVNTCSRVLKKFDVERCGKEAGKIAYMAKNPKEGNAGKYDVIFDPLAFAALLSDVGTCLGIFHVESGMSFLKDKIGQEVGSKKVTLIDDALMVNGYGSTSFDNEGMPTKKNVLVKDGILKTYYHNTSSSRKYNVANTFNAGLLSPGSFNLELIKGSKSREKLISNIDKGILVTNVWYTRFNNYHTGDFSTIPRDGMFLIKNGKIVKSIKHLRVSDNMLRMFKNIKEVGSNSEQIVSWEADGNLKCPSVFFGDVNVTKAKD